MLRERTCTDAGTQCLSDDYSYNYTCKVCGGTGQACCSSFYSTGPACKDPGTACDSSTGVCKACGAAGGPCCANSTCTGPGTTCKNSLCVVCGTPGTTSATATPCCDGNTCTSGCCITRYGGSYAGAALCIAAGAACDTLVLEYDRPSVRPDHGCWRHLQQYRHNRLRWPQPSLLRILQLLLLVHLRLLRRPRQPLFVQHQRHNRPHAVPLQRMWWQGSALLYRQHELLDPDITGLQITLPVHLRPGHGE